MDYFSFRQVIWSDIRCLDFVFNREYSIKTTYIRPYYLSGADIIVLSYCKSYINRHYKMASRVLFLSFLFLDEFEKLLHH